MAVEVIVSVAAKLAEYLVDPTVRQLQYLFCVGKITINVEIEKEELKLKQRGVQERVQEAINRTERIDDEVDKWKKDVEGLIAEVENLEEELKANSSCLQGWRPTWRRYCLCKKLAKTTQRMIVLNDKSKCFNSVSHPVIAPDIGNHSSQNFKFFNSTQMAYNQLWEALQDDGISIIGLWGMGGSGKTSLVTEVKKKAKDSGLFDLVVLTTISQKPPIRDIQGEIADKLGLKLEEESIKGRANRIALRLQSAGRILMILDDVWTKLNLEDIGIPFGGDFQRSCKVVLTTRRSKVCDSMDCQKRIQLDLLNEDEAWTLFRTYANVDDTATVTAREIAMECKGLPIAIVALGTCLKGKRVEEMNGMLSRLRSAKLNNVEDEDVRAAFRCLELSYDYLATPEAKLLLLMCAMFPEDHNIAVEDLFVYGVGLGLCGNVDSFETARNEVKTMINYLIDSSLLMDNSSKFNVRAQENVKVHDMVRDVALWIASKEGRKIMVNCTEELDKLIVDEVVKDCYAVSSWNDNNGILQFLSQLDTPKLEFLLLRSRNPLAVSHASFEGSKGLNALIIMCTNLHTEIELQPQSIQHLSNLRTLRLQNWNLHDISFVVSLTRLEILDLQGSKFEKMPIGIEKLNKLKLLALSNCTIDECCYQVIGRCLQLEELYVSRHLPHSKNQNCYEYLVGPTALKKLRRYKLQIGEHSKGAVSQNEGIRSLSLGQLNISMLGATIKDLAQRATAIQFYELEGGSKCFTPNIVQDVGGMNELNELCLERCSKIECITDENTPHENAVLHRLDGLDIEDMDNLKQLCLGPSPFRLFQKLKRLRIYRCPQLFHIFPDDCNLGNLKLLIIYDCPMLTSIFPISTACTLLSLEAIQIERCNELKHVFAGEGGGDAWGNSIFPKLNNLWVHDCCKLEYACPVVLVQKFEQLQHLSIENAPRMKFVFGEEQPMLDAEETQIVLPSLEGLHLHLSELPNLVGICSKKYYLSQSALNTIACWDCPNMKLQEIRGHQLRNEGYNPLTAIETISLGNCGVESIPPYQTGIEEQIPTFQYLKHLTLVNCARLKVVFYTHIRQCLPNLTFVKICCCGELEAIFRENEETQNNLPIVESWPLKLKSLEISKCNKLQFILPFMVGAATSLLLQLNTLTISDCSQVEEIFKCTNIEDHDIDNEREIKFPNMETMVLKNLPRLVNVCQGFELHLGKYYRLEVHECPKLMPIMNATIVWTKNRLVREYELKKYHQLNNNEALNLPLSVLIAGEHDIQNPNVEHKWRVIGGDEQEETNNSKMPRFDQQMLGGLIPTKVLCFQYLHTLKVTHIKKLKFLFSKGTIVQNSLPKLISLTLSDCEELEEIIAEISCEDDAFYGEIIVLPSLKKIELINLPNFMSVYQLGLQIKVELSNISIYNCPKFTNSSLGPALQQLGTISVLTEDSNLQISSNTEQLPENEGKRTKMLISSAERLGLKDSMSLTSLWEGPTIIKFQNLQFLIVSKCRRLKCILPSTVMRSLPCLYRLWVEECEELEEMMSSSEEEDEEEHNHFPNNSLCFPQLHYLRVKRCRKLKWLFPSLPSTQSLPQLEDLHIEECCQLKGLFNCEPEIHEEGFYTNLLPKPISLKVEDCPIFSETTLAALQRRATRDTSAGGCHIM